MSFAAINGDPCVTCIEISRSKQKDPNAQNNPYPIPCEITENVTCSDGCTYTITREGVKWITQYLITIYSLCTDYCGPCVKSTVRKDEYTETITGDCEPNDKGPPRGGTYPHPPHVPRPAPGEEPSTPTTCTGPRS